MTALPALGIAFILSIAARAPLSAQSGYALALQPGAEVRFALRGAERDVMRGRTVRLAGDTIFVTPDGMAGAPASRGVLLSDLASLEVRGGRDRQRGAVIGAAALGVVTGVAGGIDYGRKVISFGDFVGTLVGNIGLGATVGYLLAPTGWLRLPLPGR